MNNYVILIPSYNDWECLKILIPKIDETLKNSGEHIHIELLIINDGSTKINDLKFKKMFSLKKVEVLNLKKNVKAQIAIATGLNFLRKNNFRGGIIVMDADGQDDPKCLLEIIRDSKKNPEKTITINRTKREDVFLFRFFYQIYLLLSFLLTFKYLKFGVYSYLHFTSLNKILSTNDIYMAYAASLAKHFYDRDIVFAPRKKRYLGESQNNYWSLTHYALKIISVFRYQVLINSSIIIFAILILLNFEFLSSLFLLFFLLYLTFNIIIFLIARQINKSEIIKDTLTNIKNIETLIS